MKAKLRRLPDWIDDIRSAILDIRADMGTLSKEAFLLDGKTQRAVIKGLTDIGEASNLIMKSAPNLQQQNAEAWQHFSDVYAMRVRLTHAYHRTNPSVVFDTVVKDIPVLERVLANVSLPDNAVENDGSGGAADQDKIRRDGCK
jgi:uncharacterized protein with HEPN domain